MSDLSKMPDGKPVLILPAVLDLGAAPGLKSDLQEGLAAGDALQVDAEAVQRVSSLCLQLLAAAAQGAPGLVIRNASPAFAEMASGLSFGLEGGHLV